MIIIIWGDDFISSYLSLGNNRSINNSELHTMGMLCNISKCLQGVDIDIKGTKVDLRLHPLMIQRSGTGKDPVFNLARDIASGAGIKFTTQSSLTSAAFVGSAGRNREPVPGVASKTDILAFKEVSTLFSMSNQEHSSDLINLINMALDYGGHVKKDLGGMSGSVEYNTAVSLLGTTYPPRAKVSYIEAGFLPRTLFGYKEVGKKFYFDVVDWLFDNVGETERAEDTSKIKEISSTLSSLKENCKGMKFSYPEKRAFHSMKDTLETTLAKYPIRVQQSVEPYITRVTINTIKAATCFAAIDGLSREVRQCHIEKACKLMEYSVNGLLAFHSRYDTLVNSNTMIIRNILQRIKEDGRNTTEPSEIAKMSGGMSIRDVYSSLETLAATGEIQETIELDGGKPRKRIVII